MTTPTAALGRGELLVPKGFEVDRGLSSAERENALERALLLPAWADNQLLASHLDVRQLEGADGFFRLRCGKVRVVFQKHEGDVVVHRIARRDDVYEGLDELRLIRSGDGLRMLAPRPAVQAAEPTELRPAVSKEARLEPTVNALSPFTDAQLASAGLSSEAIDVLRRLPADLYPDDALLALGIDVRVVSLVAELWERPDVYLALLDEGGALDEQAIRLEEEEVAARMRADLSSSSLLSVHDMAAFAALLDRPIEDWMFYLHPVQLRAVQLSPDGPMRVRGGAGTGKTVIALHRARRLAEELGGPVLVTTFVKSLPEVWKGLFATFAPTVLERLDLRGLDKVSMGIYREGGGSAGPLDDGRRRALVSELHGKHGAALGGLSAGDLEDEFDIVIEGRGVESVEAYLELPRTGRGSRLDRSGAERTCGRSTSAIASRWPREGRITWELLRREALRMLRSGAVQRQYAAVVVDEAQDLSEASMQLLIELAGGLPSPRLTVVGDGQQSIYPGGFSLRSLGVEVRGRSTVLRTNWRNTYWIWAAAQAFIAGESFDDLEDDEAAQREPDATPYPLRLGTPARLHVIEGGEDGEIEWCSLLVQEDLAKGRDCGDCVVLVPIRRGVNKMISALKKLGVSAVRLDDYAGQHEERVWVGTFHRSKGLEFKHVYVAGLAVGRWPMAYRNLSADGQAEERARQVRAAFVALTRARDTLDVVCGGRLPEPLERARAYFEE